jgi:hypothetical protein
MERTVAGNKRAGKHTGLPAFQSTRAVQAAHGRDGGAAAGMPLFLQRQRQSIPPIGHEMGQWESDAAEEKAESPRVLAALEPLQTKLTVGQPEDMYEQEAERVAEQVMRMPELQALAGSPTVSSDRPATMRLRSEGEEELRRQPIADEAEEETTLQAKPLTGQITPFAQRQVLEKGRLIFLYSQKRPVLDRVHRRAQSPLTTRNPMAVSPSIEAAIQRARGGGEKLPERLQRVMESGFGMELGNVAVHFDAEANRLNQSLNACAFTSGNDIFFRQGEYNPNSREGQELIAHELTHVSQQEDSFNNTIIQRREFGDAIRFDSLPGFPPRARVSGYYTDEEIALALYGSSAIPLTREQVGSDEYIIQVDYDVLLPELRVNFSASAEEDISTLSFERRERIALEAATDIYVREVSWGIAILALTLLLLAAGVSLVLSLIPAVWVPVIMSALTVLGTISGLQFVGEAVSDAVTARAEFEQSVRTAITRQELVEIGETFARRRAAAAVTLATGLIMFFGSIAQLFRIGGRVQPPPSSEAIQPPVPEATRPPVPARTSARGFATRRPATGARAWVIRWALRLGFATGRGVEEPIQSSVASPSALIEELTGSRITGPSRQAAPQPNPEPPALIAEEEAGRPTVPTAVPQTSGSMVETARTVGEQSFNLRDWLLEYPLTGPTAGRGAWIASRLRQFYRIFRPSMGIRGVQYETGAHWYFSNRSAAEEMYDNLIWVTPGREAGILRFIPLFEQRDIELFVVYQGNEEMVMYEELGDWVPVRHYHPELNRWVQYPSRSDFEHLIRRHGGSQNLERARRSIHERVSAIVDYRDPRNGRRYFTRYSYDPTAENITSPYFIDVELPSGSRIEYAFTNLEEIDQLSYRVRRGEHILR